MQNREKELAQRSTALTTLNQRLAACQQQAQKAHRAQDAYRTAAEAKEQAHARRDALDKAFLDAQPGLLAQALAEGAPCPVCGSVHHPAKAQLPHTAPTQAKRPMHWPRLPALPHRAPLPQPTKPAAPCAGMLRAYCQSASLPRMGRYS